MGRAGLVLPLIGLLLLATALLARALRGPGLALEPFPEPARVHLPPVDVALGDAALEGVVRGADGRPVAEALVQLVQEDEPAWGYTDASGRFEIQGVWPGEHELTVASRTHKMAAFRVRAPDRSLELVLRDPFGPTEEIPPLERAPLKGRVLAALEGSALGGYELALVPLAPAVELGSPVERRVELVDDGSFTVPDLLLGDYRVVVLPPWAAGGDWPDLCASASSGYEHTRASSQSALAIELAAGELVGVARNDEDEALEGALVLAHPKDRPERLWPPVTTDDEGGFALRDLPPGDYELELRAGQAELRVEARAETKSVTSLELPQLHTRGGG